MTVWFGIGLFSIADADVADTKLNSVVSIPVIEFWEEGQINRDAGRDAPINQRLHAETDTVERHRPALSHRHFQVFFTDGARVHDFQSL